MGMPIQPYSGARSIRASTTPKPILHPCYQRILAQKEIDLARNYRPARGCNFAFSFQRVNNGETANRWPYRVTIAVPNQISLTLYLPIAHLGEPVLGNLEIADSSGNCLIEELIGKAHEMVWGLPDRTPFKTAILHSYPALIHRVPA